MMFKRKRKSSTEDQHVGRKKTRSTEDREKKDEDLVAIGASEADPQIVNPESSKVVSVGASGIRNFLRELHSPKNAEIESVNACYCPVDSAFFSETNLVFQSIVAVHGLNPTNKDCHAEMTWTAFNQNMWLKDFLPKKLPTARILLFGYNSNVAFQTSIAGVREQAENLLNRLNGKRRDAMDRPILFICHSLGGLVVKRALVTAKAAERYSSIKNATYGIVFFGTPHQGGNLASLGNIAASIARLCLRNPPNSFMEALEKDSLFADELAQDFREQLEDYYVLSFYETLPFKKLGLIVDKRSATFGLPLSRETQIALDANHSDICKFEAIDSDDYEQVEDNIVELARRALLAVAERAQLAARHIPGTQQLSLISVSECVTKVSKTIRRLDEQWQDQKCRDIATWISNLNFSTKQADYFSRHQEGTGEWLLEADAFKNWLDGTERTLWCPGLPGSGKTILTSIIVDYLERSFEREDVAVAYTYCNYKEQENQTVTNLIASLLQQLVRRKRVISDEIVSLYDHHLDRRTRPTLAEWSKLLQSEVRHLSKVFAIIDAFDEHLESNNTKYSFLTEIRKLQPTVHLLVTSRHIASIEREFEKAARVEIRASDIDIRRYLEDRIKQEHGLVRHVKTDSALQEAIINTIVEKAKGMFLLAQLHMDSLATKATRKDVRKALETLPKELYDTYNEAMQRIDSQNNDYRQLAKRVLFWISFALRPLTLKELQHALAVEPDESELDQDNIPDEELLASVCAGLVTIDHKSSIIRLVHYTAQEYFGLVDVRKAWFPGAQTSIATTCLTYLSFGVFANGPCPNDRKMEARLQKNTLLSYAAQYWGDHVRGDAEHTIKKLVLDFLKQGSKLSCSIQVTQISQHQYRGYTQLFPKNVTALQVAASLGLKEITGILLAAKADVNVADSYGRTALLATAESGHLEIVERLLAAKANANARDGDSWTALQAAAESGHLEIVEKLLAAKANVNAAAAVEEGMTALQAAAGSGHLEIVERLLAAGADVNATDCDGGTALQAAAGSGHLGVVEKLLAVKADVNAAGYGGRTALQAAAGSGHLEIVEKLLAAKADVNAAGYDGRTALQAAAENGHLEIIERLKLAVKRP
ncbi:MAG: hypothetical protein M1839_001624 [Geoglossum umbratile]|nr:MAG: hypothetical protein M1839_001624 [Geoglossum umbratile]